MRHQLHASGYLYSDQVRTGLGWLAHNNGEACRRWKRRERLPIHILGNNRFEFPLARLVELRGTFCFSSNRSALVFRHVLPR